MRRIAGGLAARRGRCGLEAREYVAATRRDQLPFQRFYDCVSTSADSQQQVGQVEEATDEETPPRAHPDARSFVSPPGIRSQAAT
jgi:hypothetical protein